MQCSKKKIKNEQNTRGCINGYSDCRAGVARYSSYLSCVSLSLSIFIYIFLSIIWCACSRHTHTPPPPTLSFSRRIESRMIQRTVSFPSLRKLLLRAGSNSASSKVINVLLFYAFSFIHIYHLRLKIEIRYILISVFRCSLSVAWARLFFNDDKLTCNNN